MKIIHLFFIFFCTFTNFTWAGQSSSTSYEPAEAGSQQGASGSSQNGSNSSPQEEAAEDQDVEAQARNGEGSGAKSPPKPASEVRGTNQGQSNNSPVEVPPEENSFFTSSGILAAILIPLFSLL